MECQWLTGLSAGNGLVLNRLALARNGCGLQSNGGKCLTTAVCEIRRLNPIVGSYVFIAKVTATALVSGYELHIIV